MHSSASLLFYTLLAVAGLVFLIVRVKLSAFLALILAAVFVGLCAGMPPGDLLESFQKGVGAVLGSIAVVIGLGTILGKIIGESRAAEVIARRLLALGGRDALAWGFLFVGLMIGLPVFFAVGIVLLVPILYATARKQDLPMLKLGLPMVAGLSAAHGLIPPHPGPLAAIELLGADLAKTLLYSLPVALVSGAFAGPIFTRMVRTRLLEAEIPRDTLARPETPAPGFGVSLAAILLPMALMTSSSITGVLVPKDSAAAAVFGLLGHPVVALLAGVIYAYLALGKPAGFTRDHILRLSEESLGPVAAIILVVGCGGGFSRVLIDSGVGKAVADLALHWNLPVLPMGFTLAALIRVATGSATVGITTCAGLMKPVVEARGEVNLEVLVLAMGAGSIMLSHVNDGGFWLVKGYLNISVPQTFRTWTVLQSILSITAFACAWALDLAL